ncbi:uncharacterized protein LOC134841209 [Symsagittifera roscoffensis]|uniref:uncharacterized protein LOC134841209 n=1 Tax=Symsagittifera roscoffensis TaxID=84072 RepID=UPI00307B9AE4
MKDRHKAHMQLGEVIPVTGEMPAQERFMWAKEEIVAVIRDSIKYLGRMVDRHGVRPDPEAVEAVLTWKAPITETQLMSFQGFANYYREFIKGYADKVYPMQRLMRYKGKKFEWNDEAQVAFENIKRELCKAPVLGMPTEDGMYVLDTDTSVTPQVMRMLGGLLEREVTRDDHE